MTQIKAPSSGFRDSYATIGQQANVMIAFSRRHVHRKKSWQRFALGLALWLALLTPGMFARAEAHIVSSLQIAPAVASEAMVVITAAPVAQHDDGTCPAVPGHRSHHCCVGGANCHAATIIAEIDAASDVPGAAYDAAPNRTIASDGVAPLFHPPKPLIDV